MSRKSRKASWHKAMVMQFLRTPPTSLRCVARHRVAWKVTDMEALMSCQTHSFHHAHGLFDETLRLSETLFFEQHFWPKLCETLHHAGLGKRILVWL